MVRIPFSFCLILLLICWTISTQGSAITLAITNVNVVDVETGRVKQNRSVLLSHDTIAQIAAADQLDIPSGAKTVNAQGKWLLPGLVDAHVHYFQSGGLYTRPDIIDLRHIRSYEQERKWIDNNIDRFLSRYILNGVTTTIDMGGPMKLNAKVRDSISKKGPAPNIRLTGPLISTYEPQVLQTNDPPIIKARSPQHARELVKQQLPRDPDFIKIWYIVERGESAKDHLPVVKAIIDESQKNDLPVAVHARELSTAKLAVQHDADMLVHSINDKVVGNQFLQLLEQNNITYIPTLQVSKNYNRVFSQKFDFRDHVFRKAEPRTLGSLFDLQHIPSDKRPRFVNYRLNNPQVTTPADSIMAANLRKVSNRGINVVTGTDAGNIGTLHGTSYYQELMDMKAAGLTNEAILKASTVNASRIFDHKQPIGQIKKGHKADLLLLNGNPLQELTHLKAIAKIIKSGQLIEPDHLRLDSPRAIAQKQLNAYNAGNLDAFLSFFSDSVKVYDYPSRLNYQGKDAMRKIYRDLFFSAPDLHCELINRIVQGQYVIDREHITGMPHGEPQHVTAIYRISKGKIREVRFME